MKTAHSLVIHCLLYHIHEKRNHILFDNNTVIRQCVVHVTMRFLHAATIRLIRAGSNQQPI